MNSVSQITMPFATGKVELINALNGNFRETNRILAAEFKRLWLRNLSAQSGNILRQRINRETVATPQPAQSQ